jgi:hypothetical protein
MKETNMNISQYCPKCKGKFYIDRDRHGWFLECLICGNIIDLDESEMPLSERYSDIVFNGKFRLHETSSIDYLPDERTKYR